MTVFVGCLAVQDHYAFSLTNMDIIYFTNGFTTCQNYKPCWTNSAVVASICDVTDVLKGNGISDNATCVRKSTKIFNALKQ